MFFEYDIHVVLNVLRRGLLPALILLLGTACAVQPKPGALSVSLPAARPGWDLVWSDEFDKDGSPDPARWGPEVGMIRNNELQYYTKGRAENARIEGGNLVIEARKEPYEKAGYTSASLTTAGLASWTYGRIEARAKLPGGRGTWPAIWMLGNAIDKVGWPVCGEIDIMEHVGFDPDKIHCTVHTAAYNHVKGTQRGSTLDTKAPFDGFHVYATEWTEGAITFFFDDRVVFTFTKEGSGKDVWRVWRFDGADERQRSKWSHDEIETFERLDGGMPGDRDGGPRLKD
ncbi:MAG: glycoside hydrolase family 16 protein, partial [bacterium]